MTALESTFNLGSKGLNLGVSCKPVLPGCAPIPNCRFMDKMGYFVSLYSFTGPFIKPRRIAAGTADIPEFANLYCVKKELLSPGVVQHLMSPDFTNTGDEQGGGPIRPTDM